MNIILNILILMCELSLFLLIVNINIRFLFTRIHSKNNMKVFICNANIKYNSAISINEITKVQS